jgi:hypothetical protein
MGKALKEVGYATSQSEAHPERDAEFFQFLMRDTGREGGREEGGRRA